MPIRRADDTLYTLGVNLTANGSPVPIKGGEYALFADCTGTNGNLSLQMLSPSGIWIDVQLYGAFIRTTGVTMLQVGLLLPAGLVRIATTGGATTGLNAYLVGMG
jgi:hypothetical protein